MIEKQKLTSRYKDVDNYIYSIEENKAVITTTGDYVGVSHFPQNEGIKSIDFEGGPYLEVGDTIQGKKIKSIHYCYLIEFE